MRRRASPTADIIRLTFNHRQADTVQVNAVVLTPEPFAEKVVTALEEELATLSSYHVELKVMYILGSSFQKKASASHAVRSLR
jgi:hypothetical protein